MKDFLKRFSISVISISMISYLVYLFLNKQIIVQSQFIEYNVVYMVILVLIFLYLLILFGIYPIYFRMTKASLFVLWIAMIILWNNVLINNVDLNIYISDFIKILWVCFLMFCWNNVLITDKIKKQKNDSKLEIIEI